MSGSVKTESRETVNGKGEFAVSMPGPLEIVVILMVVLLLFGAKRLPEIGKSLGQGIREFKKSIKGQSDDDSKDNS